MSSKKRYTSIYDRIKLYWIVTIGGVVGVVISTLIHTVFKLNLSESDNGILANYLQVVGSTYGMVIGFVIFVVWNQYTDSERAIDSEVEKLKEMLRLATILSRTDQTQVLSRAVCNYSNSVFEIEARMAADRCIDRVHNPFWNELHKVCHSLLLESERDHVVFSHLLKVLTALSELRKERVGILKNRIPWPLWHLLVFVSIILLIPFFLIAIENFYVDFAVVWSTASIVVFILMVIYDLDDPFKGLFNISFEPYKTVSDSTNFA